MCRLPVMRAPFKGCCAAYSSRMAIRPGISVWAILISLRPQAARLRSAIAQSCATRVSVMAFIRCSASAREPAATPSAPVTGRHAEPQKVAAPRLGRTVPLGERQGERGWIQGSPSLGGGGPATVSSRSAPRKEGVIIGKRHLGVDGGSPSAGVAKPPAPACPHAWAVVCSKRWAMGESRSQWGRGSVKMSKAFMAWARRSGAVVGADSGQGPPPTPSEVTEATPRPTPLTPAPTRPLGAAKNGTNQQRGGPASWTSSGPDAARPS